MIEAGEFVVDSFLKSDAIKLSQGISSPLIATNNRHFDEHCHQCKRRGAHEFQDVDSQNPLISGGKRWLPHKPTKGASHVPSSKTVVSHFQQVGFSPESKRDYGNERAGMIVRASRSVCQQSTT